MDIKKHIIALGFVPKNGTNGIYHKIYVDYAIEIDFEKQSIDYGNSIIAESKTTQNFSQPENFVVLECVDRILTKGYKPQNIILEKTWPSGHGTSGRLDICINREDGTPYMLIECKTYGKEYNKELAKIHKDGGQLFTYFQLSGGKADVIMLYASKLEDGKFVYVNEIIKIEDDYRNGDVKDIYENWNKLTKDNGIFDSWVRPYNFQSKALTKEQLKEIKAEDSSFIFNRFLEILRHNVVSDKGNAFNKIFTLFLCKVYDETTTGDGEELKFQWLEGRDNHVDFQLRLTDLYSKGMKKFLDRTVSDFNNEDFDKRCANLNEDTKQYLLKEVNKLRLEKNNEFAIKEVYDSTSFEENAKIKADFLSSKLKDEYVIADDSGLSVDALNGAPGIYSARYSGTHGDDKANNLKVLKEMQGIENRKCRFICAIALSKNGKTVKTFHGELEGIVGYEERGENGFGYDSIFLLPNGKTTAEIESEEKNKISHRYKALEQLRDYLIK